MTRLQLWLTTHAIALGFGVLLTWGFTREVKNHREANRQAAINALTRTVNAQRDTIAVYDQARAVAELEARALADSVSHRAVTAARVILEGPKVALPNVALTPSKDSVCLTTVEWSAHVHADSVRDSVATELAVIVTNGIPAIRDQYEAALRADSLTIAARDSALVSLGKLSDAWHREADANRPSVASKLGRWLVLGAVAYGGFRVGDAWAHR